MFKGLFSGGKVMLSFILFSLFRSWGDISAHLMSVSQWYTNKALNWKLSVRLIFKHWLNYVEETTVIAYSSFINRITGYWCYTVDCRQFSADVSRDKISALIKKDLELRSCCSDSCVQLSRGYLIQRVTGLPESHQKTFVTGSKSNMYPGC